MRNFYVIAIVVAALFVGIAAGFFFRQTPVSESIINYTRNTVSTAGFVQVEPTIDFTTVHLTSGCSDVSFDVTADQAFSIARGTEGVTGVRPLTHDIMRDVLENYDVRINQVQIDRYEDGIYYATIFLQRENEILELDARPSDSIALSLRAGVPIYFRESIFRSNAENIC